MNIKKKDSQTKIIFKVNGIALFWDKMGHYVTDTRGIRNYMWVALATNPKNIIISIGPLLLIITKPFK